MKKFPKIYGGLKPKHKTAKFKEAMGNKLNSIVQAIYADQGKEFDLSSSLVLVDIFQKISILRRKDVPQIIEAMPDLWWAAFFVHNKPRFDGNPNTMILMQTGENSAEVATIRYDKMAEAAKKEESLVN